MTTKIITMMIDTLADTLVAGSFNAILASTLMLSTLLIAPTAMAAASSHFEYKDWQVACDNIHTCRIAGYQAENSDSQPVSVLLTRRAGKNASVDGKVKLGGSKEGAAKALMQLGNRHRISLIIDGKDIGEAKPFSTTSSDADLTSTQVNALLDALTKTSKIEFVVRSTRWELSGQGASAVMAKADEIQARSGTPNALITKGSEADSQSLTPQAAPQLRFIMPNPAAASTSPAFRMNASTLASILKNSVADVDRDCPEIFDDSGWRVSRLNSKQLLVQHKCWIGAYNVGQGIWVINDHKPFSPTLVTTSATNYDNGKISSVQKGRGIGDCLSKTDWIWTGDSFKKSYESTTGLCRMIETGGAWELPTYVTDVKR